MSAYICDFYHLSVLAVAIHQRVGISDHYSPERIAAILHAENVKSVEFRYGHSAIAEPFLIEPEPFTFDPRARRYHQRHSTVELIKACHCYQYQACEQPKWEQSQAYDFVQRLINQLTRELPGYQGAAWGLNEPPIRAVTG